MESMAFNAVYNANLERLKSILECHTPAKRKEIVSKKLNGLTCLLVAARNGLEDIVRYLIIRCDAHIEQTGTVEFDGEIIEEVAPLWIAAAANQFDVVKFLLKCGANVNCTTKTHSTPLRAAIYDNYFEIVKYLVEHGAEIEIANKHGHTPLMIACYKKHLAIVEYLLAKGAEVNRQSVQGNTAMHDCAESNSLEILKLLVKAGATCKNGHYGTPLTSAACHGNVAIVEYLKTAFTFTYEEQVDAYKLLGATYVDKHYDLSTAFDFWRKAVKLSEYCSKEYHQSLVNRDPDYLEAYSNLNEFSTESELEEYSDDPDTMKMQSLIIRERVLGINHPETFCFIRFRGATYADSGNYGRCLSLWLYNLEKQQQVCTKPFSDITQSCFVSIIELFSIMLQKNVPSIRIYDIFRVLKLAIRELLSSCNVTRKIAGGPDRNNNKLMMGSSELQQRVFQKKDTFKFRGDVNGIDRHFLILIHLIGLICELKMTMTSAEWKTFIISIQEFVSFQPRSSHGYSFLHIISIITNNELKNLKAPLFEVFKLLVNINRNNLNVIDIFGNTPLHFLFTQYESKSNMVDYILKCGAHLDVRNEDGQTPLDLVKHRWIKNRYLINNVTLQCLCAHAISKHALTCDYLNKDIKDFVQLHHNKGQSRNLFYK